MARGFTANNERVDDLDGGRVIFDIHSPGRDMKRAVISNEALKVLADTGGAIDLLEVFVEYREKIGSRAGDHWLSNPVNATIILGRGDF